jgi:serine protease Do
MEALSALNEMGRQVGLAAARFGGAVVGVGRGWRVGTGVVIGEDRVLTAARHAGDGEATVTFADGRTERGTLAGADRELAIAVLDVPTGDADPLEWVDAGFEPAIGTPVVALANPGGRGLRATLGFVSSAARAFRGPRGRRFGGAIEHTAALPRGSAGGPLLDLEGRLAGLNLLRGEGGLILALGATTGLRDAAGRLARGEELRRPTLGVAVAPPWVARKMRRAVGLPEREGLLVRGVEEGGPAARAGVERGDLLVAAGGTPVDGIDSLHRSIDAAAGHLALTVVRGADERELEVELAEAAA